MHAAHRRAEDQPQMLDVQRLAHQPVLRANNSVIGVARKAGTQPIARFTGPAVADAVGQDDVIAPGVEWLSGTEQRCGKCFRGESAARAIGPMQDQHCVAYHAARVTLRRAECGVVQLELRQRFTRGEAKVANEVIALCEREVRCAGDQRDEAYEPAYTPGEYRIHRASSAGRAGSNLQHISARIEASASAAARGSPKETVPRRRAPRASATAESTHRAAHPES